MNLKGYSNKLLAKIAATETFIPIVVNKSIAIINKEIKQLTVVDTGVLQSKWEAPFSETVKQGNAYIGKINNKTNYADYVNTGHHLRNGAWWEGYHFVEIGIMDAKPKVDNLCSALLKHFLES